MKQRLPFILLGIGIGIILANIVYSFVPNVEYREYTDEEIIEQAKGLGMIFIKDNIEVSNDEVDDKIDQAIFLAGASYENLLFEKKDKKSEEVKSNEI